MSSYSEARSAPNGIAGLSGLDGRFLNICRGRVHRHDSQRKCGIVGRQVINKGKKPTDEAEDGERL